MNELTGGNQPSRVDIRKVNALLQDKVKSQEKEVEELKAVLNELIAEIDPGIEWFRGEQSGEGEWRVGSRDVWTRASKMPNFTRWWCQREGLPNPLEGSETNAETFSKKFGNPDYPYPTYYPILSPIDPYDLESKKEQTMCKDSGRKVMRDEV